MRPIEFLRAFIHHLTLASLVLFVLLLIGEFFVPGSVLPFVNLVDLSPVLLGLVVLRAVIGR